MAVKKQLNIVDIENGLEAIASKELSSEEYGKELVLLFSSPNTLKRIASSKSNIPEIDGGILWREKLHYAPCSQGKLNETLEKLKQSPKSLKGKVRLLIVNDGKTILVFDRKYNELTECTVLTIKDEPQLFLPLIGQEGFRREQESEVDIKATGKLAKLYDALIENNADWLEDDKRHDLNHFMTQVIFCLFAEDTGIFPKDILSKTLNNRSGQNGEHTTQILLEIFNVLDIPETQRGNTSSWLAEFPYVNGGLFSGVAKVPSFSPKAHRYLLEAAKLDWKYINPDILGSSIQAIVDPEMRGNLGMHYTSVPNILKTLDPLFLDDLRNEFFKARHSKKKLNEFLKRLSNIVIFDPACGSGNFLVIAYRELRKLELQALDALRDIDQGASIAFGFASVISLNNFYGIELADFASETAKLALWIVEYQQNARFSAAFGGVIPSLPLKESGKIFCNNALRVSWEKLVEFDDEKEIYIVSNPPYLGARDMSKIQKEDLKMVFSGVLKGFNNIDYVSGWFWKSLNFCNSKNRSFALVSTKTVTQGVHISKLWKSLMSKNMEIGFAYRSFEWRNNAASPAGVTCVIVGMRNKSQKEKRIFEGDSVKIVKNINAYLMSMKNFFVKDESRPINQLPPMFFGNMPNDGGFLLLNEDEKNNIITDYPEAKVYIKQILGAKELINNLKRYCIWVGDEDLSDAMSVPPIAERIENCRAKRAGSDRKATKKLASSPHKFGEIRLSPCNSLIAIPSISSCNREYLPVDVLTNGEIISNKNFGIPSAQLWLIAIITSKLFITWVSTVCVRLRNDYSLSNTLGWNTFPVPLLDAESKSMLDNSARHILLTREKHYPKSIADLYDPKSMPEDLRKAHEENDILIESLYREEPFKNDNERLEHLFERYVEMVEDKE